MRRAGLIVLLAGTIWLVVWSILIAERHQTLTVLSAFGVWGLVVKYAR